MDENQNQQALVIKRRELVPPGTAQVIPVAVALGRNPPRVNLRDHAEYAGQSIVIDQFTFKEGMVADSSGEVRQYAMARAWIFPADKEPTENDCVILVTGAENIVSRLNEAIANELAEWQGNHFAIVQGAVLRGTLNMVRVSGGHTVWTLD